MLFHAQTELILAPALLLNVLALICALCGGWLLASLPQVRARHAFRDA